MAKNPTAFVFSARIGNHFDFARLLVPEQNILALGRMNIRPCSGCDCECLRDRQCPVEDDMGKVFCAWNRSDLPILLVPVYDGRPPALFFAFLERIPGIWKRSEQGFSFFDRDIGLVMTGTQGLAKAFGLACGMLRDSGCRIAIDAKIDPTGLPFGGKVRGGLVENPEVQEVLSAIRAKIRDF